LSRPIGSPVVDNQLFPIGVRLIQHTLNARANKGLMVVCWRNDAH